MYQSNKTYWEVRTVVRRIGKMVYLVKGPEMVHKRHYNQIKSRCSTEENTTLDEVEPMEVLFDTCNGPIHQKAPEIEVQKRVKEKGIRKESKSTKKEKILTLQSKSKKGCAVAYLQMIMSMSPFT